MTTQYAINDSFAVTLPIQTVNVGGYKIEFVKYDGGFKIVSVNGGMISNLTNGDWMEVCALVESHKETPSLLDIYIAAIKKEILEDAVLADCKTFAELHDYCDANMLGFESMPEFDDDEKMIDFANAGMDAIDAWLRKGSK
jgi:hypothetical protein